MSNELNVFYLSTNIQWAGNRKHTEDLRYTMYNVD